MEQNDRDAVIRSVAAFLDECVDAARNDASAGGPALRETQRHAPGAAGRDPGAGVHGCVLALLTYLRAR